MGSKADVAAKITTQTDRSRALSHITANRRTTWDKVEANAHHEAARWTLHTAFGQKSTSILNAYAREYHSNIAPVKGLFQQASNLEAFRARAAQAKELAK